MNSRCQLVNPAIRLFSIRKQCDLLSINRNRLYYKPVDEKPENIQMMQIMDKHLLNHPTEGVRSMVYLLRDFGYVVNPKRIRRLFKLMNHQTLYRKRNLSKLGKREYIKPYLLRGLKIEKPNQVWCTDITYIPMHKGFMYMTAIMDVYSRKILSWGISNSMDAAWCKGVLQDAIETYGIPEIINSDQGSQYSSALWTQFCERMGINISMDGKGRATDNAWIERFWKSLKNDFIYLNPCDDGIQLYQGISQHINYYHNKTHHATKQKPENRYKNNMLKAA